MKVYLRDKQAPWLLFSKGQQAYMMELFASNGMIYVISLPWAQEAYTEYLRSIHYISQVLLEEVEATKGTASLVLPRLWTAWPLMGLLAPDLGVSHVLPAWSLAGEHLNTRMSVTWSRKGWLL